jgi:hypothetical protein
LVGKRLQRDQFPGVKVLGLDREELDEMRRRQLETARRTRRVVEVLQQKRKRDGKLQSDLAKLLAEHEAVLQDYRQPSTEYSVMLRAARIIP